MKPVQFKVGQLSKTSYCFNGCNLLVVRLPGTLARDSHSRSALLFCLGGSGIVSYTLRYWASQWSQIVPRLLPRHPSITCDVSRPKHFAWLVDGYTYLVLHLLGIAADRALCV